jgi:predicted Zn-dependent protease
MVVALVIALSLLMAAPAHAGAPVTGRQQDFLFARDDVQRVAAAAYDKMLAGYREEGQLDQNRDSLKRLQQITDRLIAQAVQLKPAAARWHWVLHITSDPTVSAFCMAGGKLMVGSHFLQSYHLTDAELAVVLGHEVGHAIAEHIREQLSAVVLQHPHNPDRNLDDVIAEMNSDIGTYLRLAPLSQVQEQEADRIGIRLAAMAGYPPSAALDFYAKLAQDERRHPGRSLFNTHLPGSDRRHAAEAIVADVERYYHSDVSAAAVHDYLHNQ